MRSVVRDLIDRVKRARHVRVRAVALAAGLKSRVARALEARGPRSTAELLAVPGVGPATVVAHGSKILAALTWRQSTAEAAHVR